MITKIEMDCVASYKKKATLETDKKVNLIYGLNGTGKSTISNYLYSPSLDKFSTCRMEGVTDEKILVYNQNFVRDYFYETDSINGIFTLSKENKEAEKKIDTATQQVSNLEKQKQEKNIALEENNKQLLQTKNKVLNETWNIKTEFSGGDRVLEFCLDGLKGKKEKLFDYLSRVEKSLILPQKTITELKSEVELIKGDNAQKYDRLPLLSFNEKTFLENSLLKKEIVGNTNSSVSDLIEKLQNSDWVKKGIQYLPEDIDAAGELCPFCQKKTITKDTIRKIKEFFDESYERDIDGIGNLLSLDVRVF